MSEEVTEKWIAEAKKKYGRIFKVPAGEQTYIYRPLTRDEYKGVQDKYVPDIGPDGNMILKPSDAMKVEDEVVELCVIWPENIKVGNLAAGVPAILSLRISECSGFAAVEEPEEL